MNYLRHIIALAIGCVALTACTLGDDYVRPDEAISLASSDTPFLGSNAAPANASQSMHHWWERLNDPLLNEYVARLRTDNLSLIQAGERILQAREQGAIAGASLAPSISLNGAASRQRINNAAFIPVGANQFAGGSGGASASYIKNYSADVSASWQLDIFGRVRRSIEAAQAEFNARIYDRQALEQSLITELVRRRAAIAINAALLTLAQDTAKTQERIYTLTELRYNLGSQAVSAADVYLAKENVATVQADIARQQRTLDDETYRLDILLGTPPGTHQPHISDVSLLPPPMDIAPCLPAALLDRRPDIRASELQLAAANANIGVAIADLYPDLTLSAGAGFNTNDSSSLFNTDQYVANALASITQRIFNGGALRANIRLQEARARELAAAYANTILTAMQEVETALSAERELATEIARNTESVEALQRAETLSEARYRRGIIDLRALLETQQRRYAIQQQLLLTQQAYWNNRLALYLALGGDWTGEHVNTSSDQITACAEQRPLSLQEDSI